MFWSHSQRLAAEVKKPFQPLVTGVRAVHSALVGEMNVLFRS